MQFRDMDAQRGNIGLFVIYIFFWCFNLNHHHPRSSSLSALYDWALPLADSPALEVLAQEPGAYGGQDFWVLSP